MRVRKQKRKNRDDEHSKVCLLFPQAAGSSRISAHKLLSLEIRSTFAKITQFFLCAFFLRHNSNTLQFPLDIMNMYSGTSTNAQKSTFDSGIFNLFFHIMQSHFTFQLVYAEAVVLPMSLCCDKNTALFFLKNGSSLQPQLIRSKDPCLQYC